MPGGGGYEPEEAPRDQDFHEAPPPYQRNPGVSSCSANSPRLHDYYDPSYISYNEDADEESSPMVVAQGTGRNRVEILGVHDEAASGGSRRSSRGSSANRRNQSQGLW